MQTKLESFVETKVSLNSTLEKVLEIFKIHSSISLTKTEVGYILRKKSKEIEKFILELQKLGLIIKTPIKKCKISNKILKSWILK